MSDLDLLLQPIPGPSPAGSNARYEAPFPRLEEELAKLTALSGESPDWRQVADDATTVLTTLSKDLLTAVYLTRAWFEREGPSGLHDGLLVIEDILTTYWDDGFPALSRLRARRSALQWLGDGLEAPLQTCAPAGLAECQTIVARLQESCRERFDGDTGLAGLARALAGTPAAVDESATAASRTQVRAGAQIGENREEVLERMRQAAQWFIDHEPQSPVGFLALRAAELATRPFHLVYRDLLANHQSAQSELWHVLGLPNDSEPTPGG
jgi:type VI secretion system ImpA/VasJ family protein